MLLLSKTLQRLGLETVGGREGYTPLRDNRGHRRTLSHAIEMQIKCYNVHKTCKSQGINRVLTHTVDITCIPSSSKYRTNCILEIRGIQNLSLKSKTTAAHS